MAKIRIGVLGAGSIGYQHIRILHSLDTVDLIGLLDINQEIANAVGNRFEVKVFNNTDEIIGAKPDAIVIAVPASCHESAAMPFINLGIPLLIEKPVAHDINSASRILEAAKVRSTPVMIGHIERFNPAVVALKKLLSDKKIVSMNFTRVGPTPPRVKDVGITVDLSIHDIDLAIHLTGEEIADSACVTHSNSIGEKEDVSMILLKTKGGCAIQIHSNWLTPVKARTITVATENEFIIADLIAKKVVIYNRFPDDDNNSIATEIQVDNYEPLREELSSFISCIAAKKPFPIDINAGMTALKIATDCIEAAI